MDLYIATEQRFFSYRGAIYAEAVGGYAFWQRYLSVFTAVYVVARVQHVSQLPQAAIRAEGEQVRFVALPNYQGVKGWWRIPAVVKALSRLVRHDAAYILRVPGAVGTVLGWFLRWHKRPFSLEVVVDPYHSLSPEALQTAWARPVRALFVRMLKAQCQQAAGVAYVTEQTLQAAYPAAGFTAVYSSLDLSDHYFKLAEQRRMQRQVGAISRLLFIGSLWQRHKGLHVLLEAIHLCVARGFPLQLDVLGDGPNRSLYETMVSELGLAAAVQFHGYVEHGIQFDAHLEQADLFVLPTLGEGLPRAMIEAMAAGLPVVGSNVTGIPELLPVEDMVPANNVVALANKLQAVVSNPQRLAEMSFRNQERARHYRGANLRLVRQHFYEQVRRSTLGEQSKLTSVA